MEATRKIREERKNNKTKMEGGPRREVREKSMEAKGMLLEKKRESMGKKWKPK